MNSSIYAECFKRNIRLLRNVLNHSTSQFANELSVSKKTIEKWENGTALPQLGTLLEIVIKYGISLDWLIGADRKTKFISDKYSIETVLLINELLNSAEKDIVQQINPKNEHDS